MLSGVPIVSINGLVSAEEEITPSGLWTDRGNTEDNFVGSGTEYAPYQIAILGQLAYLAKVTNDTRTNISYANGIVGNGVSNISRCYNTSNVSGNSSKLI